LLWGGDIACVGWGSLDELFKFVAHGVGGEIAAGVVIVECALAFGVSALVNAKAVTTPGLLFLREGLHFGDHWRLRVSRCCHGVTEVAEKNKRKKRDFGKTTRNEEASRQRRGQLLVGK
jgi:hypothetical protein